MMVALLCLLAIKLGYTGLFLYRSGALPPDMFWQNPQALAGEDIQPAAEDGSEDILPAGDQAAESPSKNSLAVLEIKRMELEEKEKRLEAERRRLNALKKDIDQKLSEITRIQEAVRNDLEKKEAAQSDRIKHLIKAYQAMPARKAAVLIEKLDMDVIIALFSQMKGENVGQILPYVSAEKAAKISERLAKVGL
jgi:flagellar motility protein MotE (MotC chaperone)